MTITMTTRGQQKKRSETVWKISETVGYNGDLVFDLSMPDGTPRKFLDSSKIKKLGWKPKFNLSEGIQKTYKDYLEKYRVYHEQN